ncbi:hypothetical protein BS47DRAFT_1487771 [Hydnum rufescens UP504]|uniref:Vacuolar protein sorting-associated protein 51 homolog n=1 Tax=Hydnum rufescens UP504 TaxID=1448309 RepID=A0A9P6AQH4_9AGAM|nr:hypothetical protein BS47DRAFT_1487771 [Hydnum rufescens UP504]
MNQKTLSPPRRQSERKASGGRARDLLRQHYGLGGLPIPAPTGLPNDPLDIDSPAFNAEGYFNQLAITSSLPILLKRENELAEGSVPYPATKMGSEKFTEIRQLNGERQSLVYNHHHELIAASDTIRAMKSRAENVDADLEKLKAAFSEISRIGAKLSVEIGSGEKKQLETPAVDDRDNASSRA